MIDPRAEAFTLREEGGRKPPGPGDPNPTQFGITQRVYDRWRVAQGLPSQPVYQIEDTERHAIYQQFWDADGGDDLYALSPELALLHFDCAFNAGPREAAVLLQRTVGVAEDGQLGPMTYSAAQRCMVSAPVATLTAYLQNRWDFLQGLANFPVWGSVWGHRLNACAAEVGVTWTAQT